MKYAEYMQKYFYVKFINDKIHTVKRIYDCFLYSKEAMEDEFYKRKSDLSFAIMSKKYPFKKREVFVVHKEKHLIDDTLFIIDEAHNIACIVNTDKYYINPTELLLQYKQLKELKKG